MNRTEQRALSIVNPLTGEMIPQDEPVAGEQLIVGTDAVIADMELGTLPLYMRKLQELPLPEEEKEPLLSLYTGVSYRSLNEYINLQIEVLGAAILYHGPYMGKDKLAHDGYYFTALLTSEQDNKGNLVVLRTSSAGTMLHMAYALNQKGWFLWEKPTTYTVTKGEDGSFRLKNMERPKALEALLQRPRKG